MKVEDFFYLNRGGGINPINVPVLPVYASFCSSWDRKGRVIFDPETFPYLYWRWKVFGDLDARDDYYSILRQKADAGITHVVLDPPDGTVYSGVPDYYIKELPNWMPNGVLDPLFIAMCDEILGMGFIGVFYYYGGGQTDAVHIYDGQLKKIANQIRDNGWTKKLVQAWAWESFGREPECTEKQNDDAWMIISQESGEGYTIAAHVNSSSPQRFTWYPSPYEKDCYIPETDTGEIEAHYVRGGGKIKVYFGQIEARGNGPVPGYEGRLIEGLDRFFHTGTPMPGIGTENFYRDDRGDTRPYAIGPFWFGRERQPSDEIYCMWEPGLPYAVIRNWIGPSEVRRLHESWLTLGLVNFGCAPVN